MMGMKDRKHQHNICFSMLYAVWGALILPSLSQKRGDLSHAEGKGACEVRLIRVKPNFVKV